MLKAQPDLSQKKLAELSGLSIHSVRHHLESLQASGHIRHVGPNKGGYWEIMDGDVNYDADDMEAGV